MNLEMVYGRRQVPGKILKFCRSKTLEMNMHLKGDKVSLALQSFLLRKPRRHKLLKTPRQLHLVWRLLQTMLL